MSSIVRFLMARSNNFNPHIIFIIQVVDESSMMINYSNIRYTQNTCKIIIYAIIKIVLLIIGRTGGIQASYSRER